jgi:hypothetical protein
VPDNNVSRWEKLAAVATLAQAVFVIISISFIRTQLSLQTEQLKIQSDQLLQQTKLTRAGNVQALAALALPMNFEEAKDRDLARLSLLGQRGFENVNAISDKEVRESQYQTLLASWLIFYENMFYQHSEGLLSNEVFKPWDKDLKDFVMQSRLSDYWDEMKSSYHEDFRKHIDQILKDNKPSP